MPNAEDSLSPLSALLPSIRIARRSNGLASTSGILPFVRRRTAIVGTSEWAAKLLPILSKRSRLIQEAFLDGLEASEVRSLDTLVSEARDGRIQVVYLAPDDPHSPWVLDLVNRLGDTTASIYLVADPAVCPFEKTHWSAIGQIPVLCILEDPTLGFNSLLKRSEDLLLGSLILATVLIPMMAIAVAIKLLSPGPLFSRQWRYGLHGQRIRILKFRTMSVFEDGPNVVQATKTDARITPLGRFLRRTSLDEFPQFLQVLTGELSLVGPRPHAVAHSEEYRGLIPGYMLRHKVKPGITGWAQINGWRGETAEIEKMEQRVRHDLEYVRNWSLSLDLRIIFRSVFGIKKSRNAY